MRLPDTLLVRGAPRVVGARWRSRRVTLDGVALRVERRRAPLLLRGCTVRCSAARAFAFVLARDERSQRSAVAAAASDHGARGGDDDDGWDEAGGRLTFAAASEAERSACLGVLTDAICAASPWALPSLPELRAAAGEIVGALPPFDAGPPAAVTGAALLGWAAGRLRASCDAHAFVLNAAMHRAGLLVSASHRHGFEGGDHLFFVDPAASQQAPPLPPASPLAGRARSVEEMRFEWPRHVLGSSDDGADDGQKAPEEEDDDEEEEDDDDDDDQSIAYPTLALAVSVATNMAASLEIQTRTWRFGTYADCFVGRDAVAWMVAQGLARTPAEAKKLGQLLMDIGLLRHVTNDHPFEDAHYFYQLSPTAVLGVMQSVVELHHRLQQTETAVDVLSRAPPAPPAAAPSAPAGPSAPLPPPSPLGARQLAAGLALLAADRWLEPSPAVLALLALLLALGGWAWRRLRPAASQPEAAAPARGPKAKAKAKPKPRPEPEPLEPEPEPQPAPPAEPPADQLPPVAEWRHRPVLLRAAPRAQRQSGLRVEGEGQGQGGAQMPLGEPVPFSTSLFEGRALVLVRDAADLPAAAAAYFAGRKRTFCIVVQGQVKRRVRANAAMTGNEFDRPFKGLPARWLVRASLRIVRRLSPALREDLMGEQPFCLSPLLATTQALHAAPPGGAPPPPLAVDVPEDSAALFAGDEPPLGRTARKRHFGRRELCEGQWLEPGTVYTFEFYQHMMHCATYELDMGIRRFQLASYLDGQPIQLMAKDADSGDYLWNFEVLSESLCGW